MSHPNIAHWGEVEEHDHEEGSIHSAWRYLGEAAGTVGVGVNRIRIHSGCRSTPLHSHGDHEEIFFVFGGSAQPLLHHQRHLRQRPSRPRQLQAPTHRR